MRELGNMWYDYLLKVMEEKGLKLEDITIILRGKLREIGEEKGFTKQEIEEYFKYLQEEIYKRGYGFIEQIDYYKQFIKDKMKNYLLSELELNEENIEIFKEKFKE